MSLRELFTPTSAYTPLMNPGFNSLLVNNTATFDGPVIIAGGGTIATSNISVDNISQFTSSHGVDVLNQMNVDSIKGLTTPTSVNIGNVNITSSGINIPTGESYKINSNNALSSSQITLFNGANFNNINTNTVHNVNYSLPNKSANDTFAMLSDISGSGFTTGFGAIPTSLQNVYVSLNGNDTSGNGTQALPFATISHAMTTITDSGINKRYSIIVASGIYESSASTILFKPYVYIVGESLFSTKISANIGLDASCLTQNVRIGASGCNFSGGSLSTIDFTTDGGHNHVVEFQDCQFNCGNFIFKSGASMDYLTIKMGNVFNPMTLSGGNIDFVGVIYQATLQIDTAFGVSVAASIDSSQFLSGNVVALSTGSNTNMFQLTGSAIVPPYTLTVSSGTAGNTTYQYDASSYMPVARFTNTNSSILVALSQPPDFLNITLPATTSSVGQIKFANQTTLHSFGSNNIYVGAFCGNETLSGTNNTGCGYGAGQRMTSGAVNTLIGEIAGNNITTGAANVLVGSGAGSNVVSGGANTLVGTGAGSNYTTSESNNIILGAITGTIGDSATCYIGNIGTSTVTGSAVYVTSGNQLGVLVSSEKFKEQIKPLKYDSELFYKLNPVEFVYKSDKNKIKQYGLIAEEVDKLFPDLTLRDEKDEIFSVKYQNLNAMLIKEIQDLKASLNEQQLLINYLMKKIN